MRVWFMILVVVGTASGGARGDGISVGAGAGLAWIAAAGNGNGSAEIRPAAGVGYVSSINGASDFRLDLRIEHMGAETDTGVFGILGTVRLPYLSLNPMVRWYLSGQRYRWYVDGGMFGAVVLSRKLDALGSLVTVDLSDRIGSLDFGVEGAVGLRAGGMTALDVSLRGKFGLLNISEDPNQTYRTRFLFLNVGLEHRF